MSMKVMEVKRWLGTLSDLDEVYIDDGGLSLRSVQDDTAYIEVGGFPDEDDPLSPLFRAMENHGNSEGTETQLGDAEEFLRLAFDMMLPAEKEAFLRCHTISEFTKREG